MTFSPGAVGSAITLTGDGAHLTVPPVLNTEGSFSMSAWVRIDPAAKDHILTVLSEQTSASSRISLTYRPENGGYWSALMQSGDPLAGASANSQPNSVQLGVWTNLTFTYDARAGALWLYVNGVTAGAGVFVQKPSPSAPIQIGCMLWGTDPCVNKFIGQIDEVRLYDRQLSADEIPDLVQRDNVQTGYWKLNDGTGTTAVDGVQGGPAGVLGTGASFTTSGGPLTGSVHFDGTAGAVKMGTPMLRTDKSFSVGAWVRLDQVPATDALAVSQEGFAAADGAASGVGLGLHDGNWVFTLGGAVVVTSPKAKAGVWTHVTGTLAVLPTGNYMVLYVNGAAVNNRLTTTVPQVPSTTGQFVIGRGQAKGAAAAFWPGNVAEVRTYSREVSPASVKQIVQQDNVRAGQWPLNGDTKDVSGHSADATLSGGTSWTQGHDTVHNGKAVQLDGTTGSVQTPNVLRTDQDFTVAAWVKWTKASDGSYHEVLSADGTKASAFMLRVTNDGKWAFSMTGQDATNGGTGSAQATGPLAQKDMWTHLVGMYSVTSHQISLYVNGTVAATAQFTVTPWNASGGLAIGRGKWNGAPVEFFPGAIDSVTVYGRDLFDDEIAALVGRDLNLVHEWALTEKTGTTAADAIGAKPGTLSGSATFGNGPFGGAVQFDGTPGAVSTDPIDTHTDQNFSVSAWVYVQKAPDNPAQLTAVSLDGAHGSRFRLGYVKDNGQNVLGAWVFDMPVGGQERLDVGRGRR